MSLLVTMLCVVTQAGTLCVLSALDYMFEIDTNSSNKLDREYYYVL